jgi:hypothetical protein
VIPSRRDYHAGHKNLHPGVKSGVSLKARRKLAPARRSTWVLEAFCRRNGAVIASTVLFWFVFLGRHSDYEKSITTKFRENQRLRPGCDRRRLTAPKRFRPVFGQKCTAFD